MSAINIKNLKTQKHHIFLKKKQIFLLFTVSVVMNITLKWNNQLKY